MQEPDKPFLSAISFIIARHYNIQGGNNAKYAKPWEATKKEGSDC